MEAKWYERFFEGVSLELWEQAIPEEKTRDECAMIKSVLRPKPSGRLLDVPCGPGRHLATLAAKGYHMTGIDISQEALDGARNSLQQAGLKATLICANMSEIPKLDSMDAAYCLGNSFGYFDRDQTQQFLKSLAVTLTRKAGFLLNTAIAAESILTALDERNWLRIGDILFLIENEYDASQSRLDSNFTFIKDGISESKSASHYVFTVGEIQNMLRSAGFHVKALFSTPQLDPFELGCDELYVYSEKI
jgi:cyclopropane fatty-acyl-phospholipid synthase-like methyltransferase